MHKTCFTGNLSFEVEFSEVRPGLSIIITIYYCVKTIFVQFCCCIKSLFLIKLTLGCGRVLNAETAVPRKRFFFDTTFYLYI